MEEKVLDEPLLEIATLDKCENETENCLICEFRLDLDDVWECKVCNQKCHLFCLQKHITLNQNKCPFCNSDTEEVGIRIPNENRISVLNNNLRRNSNNCSFCCYLFSIFVTSFIWYRFICVCEKCQNT